MHLGLSFGKILLCLRGLSRVNWRCSWGRRRASWRQLFRGRLWLEIGSILDLVNLF